MTRKLGRESKSLKTTGLDSTPGVQVGHAKNRGARRGRTGLTGTGFVLSPDRKRGRPRLHTGR